MGASPREKQILKAVLKYIEVTQGVHYTLKTRPEEDPTELGTYDFLCSSDLDNQPDLAIEITTFMESSDRKAYDKAISGISRELVKRLEGKLPGTFCLQIVGPTKCVTGVIRKGSTGWRIKEKPVKYRDLEHKKTEFVTELEKEILESSQDLMLGEQCLIYKPVLCDLIKISNEGNSIEVQMDYYEPNMPRNFGNGGFKDYLNRTLKEILKKKNKQLKIPKDMGKITVLVLSIDENDPLANVYGTSENLQSALNSQPKENRKYIDQIMLESKGKIEILDINLISKISN